MYKLLKNNTQVYGASEYVSELIDHYYKHHKDNGAMVVRDEFGHCVATLGFNSLKDIQDHKSKIATSLDMKESK